MSEIKNVQIYPSKVRIIPNDRFSKILFNLTDNDFNYVIDNDNMKLVEMQHHKKFGEIVSPFNLSIDGEQFSLSEPIDQFDCALLSVCISEWLIGNKYTTPAIIYRGLSGKIDKGSEAEPSKDQLSAIFNSVNKLMRLQLTYNMTDACEKLNYNNGKPFTITSTLLPCYYIKDTTINGKDATIIYFDRQSPIFEIADAKNHQLLTYDAKLLDVPKQQNTKMNITIKNYVMIRVQEIKLHKMAPIITFADVFEKCRIASASRKKKLDARNTIIEFLEHLKTNGEISSFEITKKAAAFYSIRFTYSKKPLKLNVSN